MARLARFVLPGVPHHVTQRGNRRQPTFFSDDDCRLYLDLLAAGCRDAGCTGWGLSLCQTIAELPRPAEPSSTSGVDSVH